MLECTGTDPQPLDTSAPPPTVAAAAATRLNTKSNASMPASSASIAPHQNNEDDRPAPISGEFQRADNPGVHPPAAPGPPISASSGRLQSCSADRQASSSMISLGQQRGRFMSTFQESCASRRDALSSPESLEKIPILPTPRHCVRCGGLVRSMTKDGG